MFQFDDVIILPASPSPHVHTRMLRVKVLSTRVESKIYNQIWSYIVYRTYMYIYIYIYIYMYIYISKLKLIVSFSNLLFKIWLYHNWIVGWHYKTPVIRQFVWQLMRTHIKLIDWTALFCHFLTKYRSKKHCITSPLWEEFTGDWWIPHTKGQLRGKGFHLTTSSGIAQSPSS